MKQAVTKTPPKIGTLKNTHKWSWIRMTREIKDDMYEHLNEFKEKNK
jgi:hypothetical protein